MSNYEQVAVLLQGVESWNSWRRTNSVFRPDLRDAIFYKANLAGADLSNSRMSRVNLSSSDLQRSILDRAKLKRADLSGADLAHARLRNANLAHANLSQSNMGSADLTGAKLTAAIFSNATNLTQLQLESASSGSVATVLPRGLHHPLHWRGLRRQSFYEHVSTIIVVQPLRPYLSFPLTALTVSGWALTLDPFNASALFSTEDSLPPIDLRRTSALFVKQVSQLECFHSVICSGPLSGISLRLLGAIGLNSASISRAVRDNGASVICAQISSSLTTHCVKVIDYALQIAPQYLQSPSGALEAHLNDDKRFLEYTSDTFSFTKATLAVYRKPELFSQSRLEQETTFRPIERQDWIDEADDSESEFDESNDALGRAGFLKGRFRVTKFGRSGFMASPTIDDLAPDPKYSLVELLRETYTGEPSSLLFNVGEEGGEEEEGEEEEEEEDDFSLRAPDSIVCSIFTRPKIAPGKNFDICIFVHLKRLLIEVAKKALERDPNARRRSSKTLEASLMPGQMLTFYLESQQLEVSDPIMNVLWDGKSCMVNTSASILTSVGDCDVDTSIYIAIDNIPIGSMKFKIERAIDSAREVLMEDDQPFQLRSEEALRYEKAFLSYAREDIAYASIFAEGVTSNGMKLFVDVTSIDPGADWREALKRGISEADIFFLLWSQHAAQSSWVKAECEVACQRLQSVCAGSGQPFRIHPIALGAQLPEPPHCIADLHCDSQWRAVRLMEGKNLFKNA